MTHPTAPDFEALYREDPDPFDVAGSWYERRKQAIALALLPRERYLLAWDAAAGTGELAEALRGRADRVLASDAADAAVALLEQRGLDVCRSALPAVPEGARGADLVVLGEVLYYLGASAQEAAIEAIDEAVAPSADLLAIHWLGDGDDLAEPGPAATERLDAALGRRGWARLAALDDGDFAIRIWRTGEPAAASDVPGTTQTGGTA